MKNDAFKLNFDCCLAEMENNLNYNPHVLFHEYKRFYESECFLEALGILKYLLNKGFPSAEFEMGQHYYYGSEKLVVSQDYLKAFHCFSAAAENGHAEALYYQGQMLLYGTGVVLDINQGLSSLNIAAIEGVNKAIDRLGKIYHYGYCDISPDNRKAEYYYRTAVNNGYPPSMFNLALLLENQYRFEEAYELIIQSAIRGYMDAVNYSMSTYK
ncbi:TPR repeat protein [Neobacillus niacini]|uniref:tetratricopeptide repeat protein n=1 Tax=Neobacillus niacini TaxID=86668 RepID=UPI00285CDBA1|nr:tetratricopeptide repeat protein [Neobacillus niacini]MDR7076041.1 TPR repeat protein [Neobacillus niacini]